MLKTALVEIFERDLLKVKQEILAYQDEANLWIVKGEISNSAGNLCLHLIGNLNHFMGAILANTGYVRQREIEFSAKNVARSEMVSAIDAVILVVKKALIDADYDQNYPIEKHGEIVTMPYMLLHLLTHLNYHLGQINYHRRLIDHN